MPRGDGTGPMGMGPMTGRGAGICASYAVPGYANSVDRSAGYGCGRGFRRTFCAAGMPGINRFCGSANEMYAPAVDEKELISRQIKLLENQLAQVNKRLSNIDKSVER